jgi:hypothetical protein
MMWADDTTNAKIECGPCDILGSLELAELTALAELVERVRRIGERLQSEMKSELDSIAQVLSRPLARVPGVVRTDNDLVLDARARLKLLLPSLLSALPDDSDVKAISIS